MSISLRTMKADDALRLDHQLCFALYAASRAMVQAYGPRLAELGVTYPQYLVLLVLWEEEGASMGRLGARLHLDSGTLTPLLKRLEAAGFVTRARAEHDERVVQVSLSAKGRRLREKAACVPRGMASRVGLSSAEFSRLRGELLRLAAALGDNESDTKEKRS